MNDMSSKTNPIYDKHNLHKRHGQLSGFQSLMVDLKMVVYSGFFIFCRTSSHIFWPKHPIFSDP